MSKKNIDDLFQEKLKDFGETPDERVWKAIAASLDKNKKSRKVIPLWWKLGGAAAVLALLVYFADPFGASQDAEPIITTQEENSTPKEKGATPSKEQELFAVPDSAAEKLADREDAEENATAKDPLPGSAAAKNKATQADFSTKVAAQDNLRSQDRVKESATYPGAGEVLNHKDNTPEVAALRPGTPQHHEDDARPGGKKELALPGNKETAPGAVKEAVAAAGINKEDTPAKKSIFEEIAKQEAEEAQVAETSGRKWSVGPSVAPVYFDAIGQGSPIHSDFSSNSKSGQTNLSYGVVVAYELNKKLKVRSGVHKVDYGYNTNEVAFSSSAALTSSEASIANIDYALASRNIVVSSKKEAPMAEDFVALDASAREPTRDGRMTQQFGYIEVPVELNYALVDSKFGINLIGGVSSLFLTDNSIRVESNNLSTEVGEANNINDINFSTNFGFGVNYKFTPQLQLNVEPIFKYQLNTFSETAGNFNPFSVGIYSGIHFKF